MGISEICDTFDRRSKDTQLHGSYDYGKKPYEEDPSLKSYKSRWFGNQDLGIYYMDHIIPSIKTRTLTSQDGVIHECLWMILNALNRDGNLSSEEAEELLREELQKELKDITVY